MAHPKTAWGIEIGAFAVKAIRLERDGNDVTVTDFAVIPHKKVLTTPDIDQDEIIRLSLGQFISQKEIQNESLVMSVPGHSAFARFAKLPPVEPKKVPDIVRFEAVQQIPFPIDEVEWDYETFTSEDTPEVEVGIFAMTRERVQQRLSLYSELEITPDGLTLSPVAVFNAMNYDHSSALSKGPLVYLDIGTQASDLIVVENERCWIRTFPLGGTHFTEAIAEAFKLSYSKAEKLKYEAATSKYAKQIMQAMRPVFSDLLQEVQRSIGYYQSMHRGVELENMIGIGSTFKIPGLRKFLGQQLQLNVMRLDEYKRIAVQGREAAAFSENAVNMATAYGLALQGVGLASIEVNLVPVKALREQLWRGKTKWFAAAAAVGIAAGLLTFYLPLSEGRHLRAGGLPPEVEAIRAQGNQLREQLESIKQQGDIGFKIENLMRLADYRQIWAYLVSDATDALVVSDRQAALLSDDLEDILRIRPERRRFVQLKSLDGAYRLTDDNNRRIRVTMMVELSHDDPIRFLNGTVEEWLHENADRPHVPYRIIPDSVRTHHTQLERFTVRADGTVSSTSEPQRDPRSQRDRGQPTRPGPPTPPTTTPPPTGTSGGASGAGGLQAPGDDLPDIPPPPDATGTDGQGGRSDPSPGWRPGPDRDRPGLGRPDPRARPDATEADLDAIAPIPSRPLLYPPGAEFVRVPITFEIEIREAQRDLIADQVARDQTDADEEDAS